MIFKMMSIIDYSTVYSASSSSNFSPWPLPKRTSTAHFYRPHFTYIAGGGKGLHRYTNVKLQNDKIDLKVFNKLCLLYGTIDGAITLKTFITDCV